VTVSSPEGTALFDRMIEAGPKTIARIWHGYTKPEDADFYEVIEATAPARYRQGKGLPGQLSSEESRGS